MNNQENMYSEIKYLTEVYDTKSANSLIDDGYVLLLVYAQVYSYDDDNKGVQRAAYVLGQK